MARPRSAEADAAILDAALDTYGTCGYEGMCVDDVAERAGVSKATIYRRYASKLDFVMAAAGMATCEEEGLPDTGTLRGDLIARVTRLRDSLRVTGPVMRRLVAERDTYGDLREALDTFVAARRAHTAELFARARERGEIAAGADAELASDFLAGTVFYRFFLHAEIVDDAYLARLVDAILATL